MSELVDRARNAMSVCICHGDNDNPDMEIPMSLVSELIAEVELLEAQVEGLDVLVKTLSRWMQSALQSDKLRRGTR